MLDSKKKLVRLILSLHFNEPLAWSIYMQCTHIQPEHFSIVLKIFVSWVDSFSCMQLFTSTF